MQGGALSGGGAEGVEEGGLDGHDGEGATKANLLWRLDEPQPDISEDGTITDVDGTGVVVVGRDYVAEPQPGEAALEACTGQLEGLGLDHSGQVPGEGADRVRGGHAPARLENEASAPGELGGSAPGGLRGAICPQGQRSRGSVRQHHPLLDPPPSALRGRPHPGLRIVPAHSTPLVPLLPLPPTVTPSSPGPASGPSPWPWP